MIKPTSILRFIVIVIFLSGQAKGESDARRSQSQANDHYSLDHSFLPEARHPESIKFSAKYYSSFLESKSSFIARITYSNGEPNETGYVQRLGDSSLWFVQNYIKEVNVNKIYEVSFRNRKSPGIGALVGSGVGFLASAAIGVGFAGEFSGVAVIVAGAVGIFLIPIGALLGWAIGSFSRRTFKIKGKQSLYNQYKKGMSKYVNN